MTPRRKVARVTMEARALKVLQEHKRFLAEMIDDDGASYRAVRCHGDHGITYGPWPCPLVLLAKDLLTLTRRKGSQ